MHIFWYQYLHQNALPVDHIASPPQFMLICIYGNATRLKIQTSSEDKHTKYLE